MGSANLRESSFFTTQVYITVYLKFVIDNNINEQLSIVVRNPMSQADPTRLEHNPTSKFPSPLHCI
ncbi:hypothetical protein YC2023_028969 [Brassica napus]